MLRDTTSRGLYVRVWPPHTSASERRGGGGGGGLWSLESVLSPCLVRPGRRLPVQELSEGSLGFRDRLPAWRGPGTGLKLCHQGYQRSKRNLIYGIWSWGWEVVRKSVEVGANYVCLVL